MRNRADWLTVGGSLILSALGAYQLQHSAWAVERGAGPVAVSGSAELEALRAAAGLPAVSREVVEPLAVAYRGRAWLDSNRALAPERLDELVAEAAAASGLSARLIRAVARTESDYRPGAVSEAGAVGLMQIHPDTAAHLEARRPEWLERLSASRGVELDQEGLADPRLNLLVGSYYLAQLHERYAGYGEPVATWLALAAYNWGPGNVSRHLLSGGRLQGLAHLRRLLARRAPYETRAFIERVLERSGRGEQLAEAA